MNKNNLLKKTAAVGISLLVVGGTAVPVFAAPTYTPVNGGSAVFEKYLVMDEKANVPNATFTFKVAPKTDALNSDGSTTLKVNPGVGTPTVSSAVFGPKDTTYTEAQTQAKSVTVQNEDTKGTTNLDKVDLGKGQKYARQDVTVSFADVPFTEPGVYRYIVTEEANATNAGHGIVNDSDATRDLDVYVVDTDGKLSVQGYVLHNGEDGATVNRDGSGTADKSKGFTNTYETHDITLSKTVKGNQGEKDRYYKITLKVGNEVAGDVLAVDLTNADATTKQTGANHETYTNPATLTVGSDGTVAQDFWLQDGQSVVVKGVAKNATVETHEDADTLKNDGYTASVNVTGDTTNNKADTDTADVVKDDALTADKTIAYTNDREGTISTGIFYTMRDTMIMNSRLVLPAIGVVAVIVGFAIANKKKHVNA